ncbi:MAG: substrate-binding domain-containing protein, partial [Bacteroidota bacterium]
TIVVGDRNPANVIGVVLPLVDHYFFSTILKGIMSQAQQNDYAVIVGETQHNVHKEKIVLDKFINHGIRGLLLIPCVESDFQQNLLPLIHRRIPTVVVDRMYDNYVGNYVLIDDFKGACIAVNHLIEQGYRRIAHIGSLDNRAVGSERRRGYLTTLKEANLPRLNEYMVRVNLTDTRISITNGYEAARRLFALNNPPDAIFSVTDDAALGIYKYAREHNINIPNDLGVVGFSNSIVSQLLSPQLSTIQQDGFVMGELAFKYYQNALQSNGQIFQRTFEPNLIVRGSSRKI